MALLGLTFAFLFVGHSLVSPTLPLMLEDVLKASGRDGRVEYQIINGAPLKWNWENSASAEGIDGRAALSAKPYDAVVLTERVPLKGTIEWEDSNGAALRWFNLAHASNPKARVYLYETWHSLKSGTGAEVPYDGDGGIPWRKRLDLDLSLWEGIADHVNAARPAGSPEMLLVPAGQAMAKLHDEIAAGRVPDVRDIRDLFSDDIHPNDLGRYFIAMVHYAALTGQSPEGLPRALKNEWGGDYQAPSEALAVKMQKVAWDVVRSYPRSGVMP